jgi:hypothetical protein
MATAVAPDLFQVHPDGVLDLNFHPGQYEAR